jgi:outer membrane protein assembly factor BamB
MKRAVATLLVLLLPSLGLAQAKPLFAIAAEARKQGIPNVEWFDRYIGAEQTQPQKTGAEPKTVPSSAAEANEDLWAAARTGDAKAVEALLAKGADVNARTRYGATALWFAAYKGQLDVVKTLLKHKADPDVADTIWGETALSIAADDGKVEIVKLLLEAGARGADATFLTAVQRGQVEILQAVLDKAKVKPETLSAGLLLAPEKSPAVTELVKKAGAKPLGKEGAVMPGDNLSDYAGEYESPNGMKVKMTVKEGRLLAEANYPGRFVLRAAAKGTFQAVGYDGVQFTFERNGQRVEKLLVRRGKVDLSVSTRIEARKDREPKLGQVDNQPAVVAARQNWPSFRGIHASGVADGQLPPATWDVAKASSRLWKTPIPGLGHSCPVVWEDRVFTTTAVSSDPKSEFKPGLYGAGTSAKDLSEHSWRVYCLDKRTGKVLWERTACAGVPKVKRHIKSSHANPTPATDGKHLAVSFASEGLYCYDLDGKLLWKRDLGVIDPCAFNDPDLQWGAGSSPILYQNLVIVQCDRQKDSFLAAYDTDSGRPVWSAPRDEPPSWGTPTIYEGPARVELITNGTNFIRGYDPRTGKELWRLARNSQITVPTPITGHGLIYVTSGYWPVQPIYAIWPGASGDISLKESAESNEQIAWSKKRGGPYMPTPILYGHYLYTCSNNGTVACYEARTGKQVYQERLGGQGGYTASPVAADGKLYFTSEEGEVRVVKAGPAFELLAINKMGDVCMATPAVSDGMIFFRTQHYVFGIGR